jgi:uncharacterized protein (UPF0332 family)
VAADHHKSHGGLVRRFGLHLVQTGRVAADFGRSLNRVQKLRLTCDHLAASMSIDKARWAVQEADAFVADIQRPLAEP